MSLEPHLYLASASPRRRELLQQLGVRFERVVTAVDETPVADETPAACAARLALAKARAGQAVLAPEATVLGADTIVVIAGRMLGKPRDRADGLAMLATLSGRTHEVVSAVTLARAARAETRLNLSRVTFRALSAAECAAYWATGEPADKAGGYGIQGLGASFVETLHGSHSGVMGLPLFETAELLRAFGIDLLRR